MKTNVYLGIAWRIIALFSVAILGTFIPDSIEVREFFGDTYFGSCSRGGFDPCWKWGVRHYWYFWMMVLLFILSLINVIMGIVNLVNKNYD